MPDDDVVTELTVLLNEMDVMELTRFWWQGYQPLLGGYLVYDGIWWEIWSEGLIVSRLATDGGYAVTPELNETIQTVMRDALGITLFEPVTIKDIVSAKLDVQFQGSVQNYSQTVTGVNALSNIEILLSDATRTEMGGCPFYEAYMTLKLASGEEIQLAMASDSCCQFMVDGQGFDYKPYDLRGVLDSGGNDILFQYFDLVPMTARGE